MYQMKSIVLKQNKVKIFKTMRIVEKLFNKRTHERKIETNERTNERVSEQPNKRTWKRTNVHLDRHRITKQ